jgi:hypothetical protein
MDGCGEGPFIIPNLPSISVTFSGLGAMGAEDSDEGCARTLLALFGTPAGFRKPRARIPTP